MLEQINKENRQKNRVSNKYMCKIRNTPKKMQNICKTKNTQKRNGKKMEPGPWRMPGLPPARVRVSPRELFTEALVNKNLPLFFCLLIRK
jgi:hypothetical protein